MVWSLWTIGWGSMMINGCAWWGIIASDFLLSDRMGTVETENGESKLDGK